MVTRVDLTKDKLGDRKLAFIEQMRHAGVLDFGEFTLKSKRASPYFFNTGKASSGSSLYQLTSAYADTIAEALGNGFDVVYGIPEKGIAFAPAVSMQLATQHGINSEWAFTRKAPKNYGEATNLAPGDLAGLFIGKAPSEGDRILLVDDVITDGATKLQTIEEFERLLGKPNIVGLVIAVDRNEVTIDGNNAIVDFQSKTGIPVFPALSAIDIRSYLMLNGEHAVAHRMGAYLRAYGTREASRYVQETLEVKEGGSHGVIIACDIPSIDAFEQLVKATANIDGITGYKVGFELSLRYGLPRVVEVAKKHAPSKQVIYDHQKGATDIPDTGKNFMSVMKDSGVDEVIIFPQSGPETQRAWTYRALENNLSLVVGGMMTHPAYTKSEGGYISDDSIEKIYRIAAISGITKFVVPGTKPEAIKWIRDIVESEGVSPTFYSPGFGAQNANFEEVREVLGSSFSPIVGRQITGAKDFREGAEQSIKELLPLRE